MLIALIVFPVSTHFAYADMEYTSPLKQWKQGSSPTDTDCRDDRFLMINPNDEKPVCLFPSFSMIRFAENGWMPLRNIILENPTETFTSGTGGNIDEKRFSFFEINDNFIIIHEKNNKDLVKMMHSGEKIILDCQDTGVSVITIMTLDEINVKEKTITYTKEKQTWSEEFCVGKDPILDLYYARFFT